MTGPRTSFKVGPVDVDDLLSALSNSIFELEERQGEAATDPTVDSAELLRLYRLRTRLATARARLNGERNGRSAAAA